MNFLAGSWSCYKLFFFEPKIICHTYDDNAQHIKKLTSRISELLHRIHSLTLTLTSSVRSLRLVIFSKLVAPRTLASLATDLLLFLYSTLLRAFETVSALQLHTTSTHWFCFLTHSWQNIFTIESKLECNTILKELWSPL